ncbi:MAG: hypothetical protein WC881_09575 [Elusimicrobiota bacterium]|jgi:hypothetical protein
MPDKDDFELPKADVPAVNIPDLKKQDKERKKSGAAWGSGGSGGAPFSGATGGTARAAASAARSAASAGSGAGAPAGFLAQAAARLLATTLGKVMVACAAALMLGGTALVGYKLLGHGAKSGAGPELGGISSTMKVRSDSDSGALGYVASANRGQLSGQNAGGNKPEAGNQEAGPAPEGGIKDTMDKDAGVESTQDAQRERMAHNLSGSRLSSGLGNNLGGAGGFAGANNSRLGGQAGSLSKFSGAQGKVGRSSKSVSRASLGSNRMNLRGIKSNNALANLRGMSARNRDLRIGVGESQSAAALTQFEGAQTGADATGTALNGPDGVPVGPNGTPDTGGGGGPQQCPNGQVLDPSSGSCVAGPENCGDDQYWKDGACTSLSVPGMNVTPWQGMVDTAKSMVLLGGVLLIAASLLARMAQALAATLWGAALAGALWAIAGLICGIVAGILGAMVIFMGMKINSMGGSPQGTVYMVAGGMLIAGAATAIAGHGYWVVPAIMGVMLALMNAISKLF